MYVSVNDHFQACSVAALNQVSSGTPKDVLMAFIKQGLTHPIYQSKDKKFVDNIRFGFYVHVFFVGPDMRTLKPGNGHYSEMGSCDQLAAYIREHDLGPVMESEPRWNHRHSERKPGEGDLIAYVWSPDPEKFEKWYIKHRPLVGGTTLGNGIQPPTAEAIRGYVDPRIPPAYPK